MMLPFAPLEQLIVAQASGEDRHLGRVGVNQTARVLEVSTSKLYRFRRKGLTVDEAATFADRLRVHWANLWPELVDVFAARAEAADEERRARRREQLTAAQRRWRHRHPDTAMAADREYSRRYYAECHETVRAKARARWRAQRQEGAA